jgi:GH18 family chitinase
MLLNLVLPEGQNDKNIRLAYWVDGVDIHWNYPSGNKVEKPLWGTHRCATGS